MNILHIADIANEKGNGVAVAIKEYLKYEKKYCHVAIYNLNSNIAVDGVDSFSYTKFNSINNLLKPYNRPDLVIFNEIYKKNFLKIYKECNKYNIPYVIIPHGSLVKRAQKKKWLKKFVANVLLFNKFIKGAVAIQYLSRDEYNNSLKKNRSYIISGNGIELVDVNNEYKSKSLIYIGRYDIKVKGLDLLILMCSNHKKWFEDNDVKIKLYGRASGNLIEELKKMITKNHVENIIEINGEVYEEEKKEILRTAYSFIQVSRNEGQPMGVLEALSYGIPCILTYGTNFGEYVNKNKCGIGIPFDEDKLFEAIKKMIENESFRNTCSLNTKVAKEYNWDTVIKNCISEYQKLVK